MAPACLHQMYNTTFRMDHTTCRVPASNVEHYFPYVCVKCIKQLSCFPPRFFGALNTSDRTFASGLLSDVVPSLRPTCIHTYIHACMHANIHTYIHTHIHIYSQMSCPHSGACGRRRTRGRMRHGLRLPFAGMHTLAYDMWIVQT